MEYTELIQKAINYIDENVKNKIIVNDLASLVGFSPYHFYRVFNSVVGMTVMEYVTKRKLQFAMLVKVSKVKFL